MEVSINRAYKDNKKLSIEISKSKACLQNGKTDKTPILSVTTKINHRVSNISHVAETPNSERKAVRCYLTF